MKKSNVRMMLALCAAATCMCTANPTPYVYAAPAASITQSDSNTSDAKIYYGEAEILELLDGIQSVSDIEKSSYVEKQSMNTQDFVTGDIMILEDVAYVYMEKETKPNQWMKINFPSEDEDEETDTKDKDTSNSDQKQKEITLEKATVSYSEDARFFRWVKQSPVYEVPSGLEGMYGDALSSIRLPDAFRWVNDNIKMQSAGEWTYAAIYTPVNTLKYNEVTVMLSVTVKKKTASVESPASRYTLTYTPGLSLDYISLPEGWHFVDGNQELDIGTKTYKAVFEGDPNYEYTGDLEKKITITVNKGSYNITGAVITVIKGDTLTDDLLPEYSNGKLKWDSKGITAFESGKYSCTFYPHDTKHYNPTQGIMVQVNVIPRSNSGSGSNNSDYNKPDNEPDDNKHPSGNDNNNQGGSSSGNQGSNNNNTPSTPVPDDTDNSNNGGGASTEAPNTNHPNDKDKNNKNEKEEELDINSVPDIKEDDIKKKDTSEKKNNTSVPDLVVTKTTKDDQNNSQLANIDLAQADTKKDKNTTEKEKKQSDTTYEEDPTVDKDYKVSEMKPESSTEGTTEKRRVTVAYEEKEEEAPSMKNTVMTIIMSVFAAAIGIVTYFIVKKRKLKKN